MRFPSFGALADHLRAEVPERVRRGKVAGLTAASNLVLSEIHSEIGEYQGGDSGFEDWKPLSSATLNGFGPWPENIAKNPRFAPPDNPLERTGEMRKSFGASIDESGASIGSDDPVAVWQNEGTHSRGVPYKKGVTTTPGIPAREFIGRAGFRKAPEIAEVIGEAVVRAFVEDDL